MMALLVNMHMTAQVWLSGWFAGGGGRAASAAAAVSLDYKPLRL
jgi:hypothetical protein